MCVAIIGTADCESVGSIPELLIAISDILQLRIIPTLYIIAIIIAINNFHI